jgi:hypothetical protein
MLFLPLQLRLKGFLFFNPKTEDFMSKGGKCKPVKPMVSDAGKAKGGKGKGK